VGWRRRRRRREKHIYLGASDEPARAQFAKVFLTSDVQARGENLAIAV
jgi:hypothetical protein